jgi:hypothetical protein
VKFKGKGKHGQLKDGRKNIGNKSSNTYESSKDVNHFYCVKFDPMRKNQRKSCGMSNTTRTSGPERN